MDARRKITPHSARWITWFLVIAYVSLATVGLAFQVLTHTYLRNFGFPAILMITLVTGILLVLFSLIVRQHPRNPIGWLCCTLPMVWSIDLFSFGYAYYGLIAYPGSLPGADFMLVWQAWTGGSFIIILGVLLILWFPDGRPLSPRWGSVAWLAVAATAVFLPLDAVEPGPLDVFPYLDNPFGVSHTLWAVLSPLRSLVVFVQVMCLLAAILSLFLRLGQARGDERQQLKWIVYAVTFFAVTLVFVLFGEIGSAETVLRVAIIVHSLSLFGLLAAMAIALFKYRLYDIDIIIHRTLVYGGLTVTLVAVYFASVVLLQALLQRIAGGQSTIAIVLSTLLIAALFTPLRRRIQRDIDRRFYRNKYNAEQIMETFAEAVRSETDLTSLAGKLVEVVQETMHPEHASLWLKGKPHR